MCLLFPNIFPVVLIVKPISLIYKTALRRIINKSKEL